jgi:hypothetical protein
MKPQLKHSRLFDAPRASPTFDRCIGNGIVNLLGGKMILPARKHGKSTSGSLMSQLKGRSTAQSRF